MKKSVVPGVVKPLAYTLRQYRTDVYPMSRASANLASASGELKTFLDGGRRMVLAEDGAAFVAARAARGGAIRPEVSAQKSAAGKKGIEVLRAMRRQSTPEADNQAA